MGDNDTTIPAPVPTTTPTTTPTIATTPAIPIINMSKEQFAAHQKQVSDSSEEVMKFKGTLDKVEVNIVNYIKEFGSLGEAISQIPGLLSNIGSVGTQALSLTKTPDIFSKITAESSKTYDTINDKFTSMGLLINKLPASIKNLTGNFAENAGHAENMEKHMIGMLSASGQMGQLFNDDRTVKDITAATIQYADSLVNVAKANGLTMQSTLAYADSFNRIPMAIGSSFKSSNDLINNTSSLSVALKVMSGSGQNFGEVMNAMTTAYDNLGNSTGKVLDPAQKGIQLFSMMATLSKDLNMTFKETQGFLNNIATQFKFIGDNTEAAANIMMKFTEGLRNTGLTSLASKEIISGMIDSVAKLSVGTQAFISARSGGPGGIQGSLQIDEMKRNHKTDDVMMMVLNTLKDQVGGRIVTRAEGAQSQEAASMYYKQQTMLQSGVFGNMVGTGPESKDKAAHLLEMLAAGDISGAGKMTSDEAVSTVASQGNSLQEKTNTILNSMAIDAELTAMSTQFLALNEARSTVGSYGGNNQFIIEGMNQAAKEQRAHTGSIANQIDTHPSDVGREHGKDTIAKFNESPANFIIAGMKVGHDVAKSMIEGVKEGAKTAQQTAKKVADTTIEKRRVDQIKKDTPTGTLRGPDVPSIRPVPTPSVPSATIQRPASPPAITQPFSIRMPAPNLHTPNIHQPNPASVLAMNKVNVTVSLAMDDNMKKSGIIATTTYTDSTNNSHYTSPTPTA